MDGIRFFADFEKNATYLPDSNEVTDFTMGAIAAPDTSKWHSNSSVNYQILIQHIESQGKSKKPTVTMKIALRPRTKNFVMGRKGTKHERLSLHAHFVTLGGNTDPPNIANEKTVIVFYNTKVEINTGDSIYKIGFESVEVSGTKG
jgi:hypothetical protein